MNKITKEFIELMVANAEIEITKMGEKTTVVMCTLTNGFVLLDDWCHCDIPHVTEIKILGSNSVSSQELERLRRNFQPFQTELQNLGISVELRILYDRSVLSALHDRYIISDNIAFNILPVGSLIRGQQGSLRLEENPPDFANLWDRGSTL